jgi:glycyl-tRNA synthetase
MTEVNLDDIVSLAKRRGFIFQGSEVYGGLAGTWDYGPLGVALKRNIMQLWWKMFVDARDDMYGVDAAILMNQKVWQASGHTETFTDPLVEDLVTHRRFRADHLVKDAGYKVDGLSNKELDGLIASKNIKSPDGNELSAVRSFNMMFETTVGPMDDGTKITVNDGHGNLIIEDKNYIHTIDKNRVVYSQGKGVDPAISYLRPETAQGIFTNYKNVVDSFYPDLPFGLAQQGKAFRNEISPRDFIFRAREFEQMEIEYFVNPDQWEAAFAMWVKLVHEWCDALGLPKDKVHELEVPADDRAHYSKRTVDFEFDFPIGREELLGLAYRTDFDLGNIQRASGKNMEYRPKDGSKPFVPHVIEPSFGVERAIMAVLSAAYSEDEVNGEKRVFLKLPKHLAPVKVAVSPLLKNKPELVKKAREVYEMLKKELGAVMWDDNGNIGKRYRRQDEIGTPFCVTIDFQTLEDNTVTVRDRDTAEQTRTNVGRLTLGL